MTRAAAARAFLAEHPAPPAVVDEAPPLPAEALEILGAMSFPFRQAGLAKAS
jgi:hypothetical protein